MKTKLSICLTALALTPLSAEYYLVPLSEASLQIPEKQRDTKKFPTKEEQLAHYHLQMKNLLLNPKYTWIFSGLFFGAFMFLFMDVAFPYSKGEAFESNILIRALLGWLLVGLVLSFIIHKFVYKWGKKGWASLLFILNSAFTTV